MLLLVDYDTDTNYRTLTISEDVFKKARAAVLKGEKRFHVTDGNEGLFDLIYRDNQELAFSDPVIAGQKYLQQFLIFPQYFFYDSCDTEKIYLKYFEGYRNVTFKQVNEYSIAMAEVLLHKTDIRVFFEDERIHFFPKIASRATLGSKLEDENDIYITEEWLVDPTPYKKAPCIRTFHNLFFLQNLTDLPLSEIRYAELLMGRDEGIGGILCNTAKLEELFEYFGIPVILSRQPMKYSGKMMEKYFTIPFKPADSDESNTVFIPSFMSLIFLQTVEESQHLPPLSVLNSSLVENMEEYRKEVFGCQKVLGILARGTDFNIVEIGRDYTPMETDSIIAHINKKLEEGGYDRIFVATEDEDILKQLRETFGNRILGVSQERFSRRDFAETETGTICQMERKLYSAQDYEERTEDTMVNYLYAVYLLSCCDGFVTSCSCNGALLVKAFNQTGFKCFDNLRVISMEE